MGSEAHPTSYVMDTVGPLPRGKAQLGRDSDHIPLSSTEVKNEYELTSSLPYCLHDGSGISLLYFTYKWAVTFFFYI
jgi:hypothetical protein